jgi:catechol 2,3-dioxygenase-like lactoylglutathione lyase family enzyme
VNNLEESIKFYSKYFGFKLLKRFRKEEMNAEFCYMELADFQIELFDFNDMKENADDMEDLHIRGIRHLAFEVEDVEKTVNELRELGLNFPDPKTGSSGNKYTLGKDINGIQLELIEIIN